MLCRLESCPLRHPSILVIQNMRSSPVSAVVCCAFLICILSFAGVAQSRPPNPKPGGLPRVGTINDYPATGLMTGCGNLYFYPASRVSSSGDAYIFLARGDGSNAWMNLNGRDVRLRQVKSKAKSQRPQAYLYSFGALRISVMFEEAGSVPAG